MPDSRYVLYCECRNTDDAMALHSRLLQAGVDAQLRNQTLVVRVPKCATQVWVASDHVDRAAKVAALPDSSVSIGQVSRWKCNSCGAETPEHFQVCWNCSETR